MLVSIVMVVVGIVGLFFGGNWLVKSASRLARSFGASALVIGLTIVSWATSAPELIVNVSAALQGSTEMALGNVIGSNIVNIGLCLSLMAFLAPMVISWQLVRREIPIMIGTVILAFLLALDGVLSQTDGLILFFCFLGFSGLVYVLVRQEQRQVTAILEDYEEEKGLIDAVIDRRFEVGRLTVGLLSLVIGANLVVDGAATIARALGISEFMIGLTLLAFGTSLPELVASLVAALQKQTDIAVGNIVGSNIANVLGILGLTAVVMPIEVSANSLAIQMPMLLIFSLLLLFLSFNRRVGRWKAGVLITCYAGFLLFTMFNPV